MGINRLVRASVALTVSLSFFLSALVYPAAASAETTMPESSGQPVPVEMNLSSKVRNVPAAQYVQDGTVTIRTGGRNIDITKDSVLTAAEAMAVYQVLNTGEQSLRLNRRGVAVAGSFALASDIGVAIADLVIPRNVTAINSLSQLNLVGDLVNSGKLFAVSSDPQLGESTISAGNIYNRHGATISTILSSDVMTLLSGLPTLNEDLSLALNAVGKIVNNGTISSAGDLSLSAGSSITNASVVAGATATMLAASNVNLTASHIVNSGAISALSGDINVASQRANDLAVNNTSGVMQALNGSLNFATDSTELQRLDINVLGGDLVAAELKFQSTGGDVEIHADNVSGEVNICAANAFMFTSTPNLVLGDMSLSDDPQFYNQGNIIISGDLTYSAFVPNDNLVIVASQDITSSGGNWNIGSAGEAGANSISVLMVAGADFTTNGTSPSSTAASGGGDSSSSTVITINGGTSAGGMIDLNTTTINSLSTAIPSGNGVAGSITLIAFGGTGANSGTVKIPSSVTVTTSTSDTSSSGQNGPIIIIAGRTSPGNAIEIGGINSSGNLMNPNPANGSVVLAAATPTFVTPSGSALSTLVLAAGGGNAGNPIIPNGNNFAPGAAQPGNIVINGSITAGANVLITAGGDVDINGNISLTQNPQLQPTPAAYVAPPAVTVAAGGTVTVPSTYTVSSEIANCAVCYNTLSITANGLTNAGTLVGYVVNVGSNSAATPFVLNNTGTIIGGQQNNGANDNGFINVSSLGDLQITGGGTYKTTGAVSVIELAAADNHQLQLGSANTFDINTNSLLIFNAQGNSGNIVETGNTQTIQAGSASDNNVVSINTPSLNLSNGSIFDGTSGATSFALTAGTTADDLTINVASGGTATIETTAINGTGLISTIGGIYMRPRDGQNINITSTGASTLNLETNLSGLDPVLASKGGTITISPNVTIPQTLTQSTNPAGGIVGVAFQPYVGGTAPQSGTGFVLWNTYSYQQVLALLGPVIATQQFQAISTYTQQYSSGFIIRAAKQVGLLVSAGVYLLMDNNGNNVSQAVTNSDIALALQNASTYGNVLDIVVGSEDITGGTNPTNSINTLIGVIKQAQNQRDTTTSFTGLTLPITTRQVGGVYLNVLPSTNGKGPAAAMKNLLQTVDGYVIADWYPLLEPPVISALQQNPSITQTQFAALVINDIQENDFLPIANAIVSQGLSTEIYVGETGWATAGPFQAQPQWAAWYYAAMQQWSDTATNPITGGTGVPIQGYFESFDEPWKPIDVGTQEPHFGVWTANGTNNAVGSTYDLQSITQKYSLPLYSSTVGAAPVPKLNSLDLTDPQTVSLLVAGQATQQYGGTLTVVGGVAVGGTLILQSHDLASSLGQLNIPANVSVTFEKLPAHTDIRVVLRDGAPLTLNGSLNFTGNNNPTVALHVTADIKGEVFNIGSSGALNFAPPQSDLLLNVGGDARISGNLTGNITLQTTGKNGSVVIDGSIGSPTSSFNVILSGKGNLTQLAGVITAAFLSFTGGKGSFGTNADPVNTNVGSLTGTTAGSGSIVIDNDSALNLLSTTAGSILMVSADGDLTVSGPLSARTAIHLVTVGNGDLGLNQATSRTITATVLGQGSITDTSGGVLSASGSISLSSGAGSIGSPGKPIKTSTRLINVMTDASAFISNTGKLGFGTVDVAGMLSVLNDSSITVKQPMTSVGSLSLSGSPGSDATITIAATAGNPAASVTLAAAGAGHIRMSGTVVADTLVLLTEGGSITGVTDATNMMAVTGAGGRVALTNLGAASVSGTAGGSFAVTSNGALSAGNISAAAGDVVLRAASGQLSVSPGATISAANGNVILNARDRAAGTIFLGTGSTVSATGATAKTGNVSIFIGNGFRKENTSTPANVVESITGTGQIFFGANSILCNAPVNVFTADSRTIVFSTGSSPGAAITVNGAVNILAQVSYREEAAAEEDAIVDTGEWDESPEGLAADL